MTRRFYSYASAAAVFVLAACAGPGGSTAGIPSARLQQSAMQASKAQPHFSLGPGYRVRIFTQGNSRLFNPDPIVEQNGFIFVAYQNNTTPTGGGGDSTIVEYTEAGAVVRMARVHGRCDGMRYNPYDGRMWMTVNEDANSSLYTWNYNAGRLTHYQFSAAPHGGGYDDLTFANGMAFVAASNPTLNGQGKNTHGAVDSVTLSGGIAKISPVLLGNATARDIPTGKTVRLNLTDPDSLTVAPNGDVVLVSQADTEIVFLRNAGMQNQKVSRVLVGTQLDDVAYARQSQGSLYIVDAGTNTVYRATGPIVGGTLFAAVPSDSGVNSFVGTVDTTNGTVTPVIIGFSDPTGLAYAAPH